MFHLGDDAPQSRSRDTGRVTKRQQALDVAIAAVVAFGCTLEVWAPKDFGSTHMTGPRAAVYVSYLVAAGALAFRRRFPLASCVVVSLRCRSSG